MRRLWIRPRLGPGSARSGQFAPHCSAGSAGSPARAWNRTTALQRVPKAQRSPGDGGGNLMKRRLFLAALVLLAPGARSAPEKVRVLLLTGANNHQWQLSSPYMKNFLEKTGRFTVEIAEKPGAALADAAALQKYDVFL